MKWVFPLALGMMLVGCPTPPASDGGVQKDGGGGGSGQGGAGGGAGGGGGGGGANSDGGTKFPPQLTMIEARVSGRTGRDLRLAIKGKDRNQDAVSVWMRLLDDSGSPLAALDTDRDGVGDTSEVVLPLEGRRWVGEMLTATATLRGLFVRSGPDAGPPAAVPKVGVALIDAATLRSEEQVIPVIAQMVRARGEACDPLFVMDRCEPGLGCRGTSPVCDEGLAPQITRMAFYRAPDGGATGPTILLEGTEPEDDLQTVRIQFQNAQGQLVSIDSDGDGMPDLASYEQDGVGLAVDGTFFLSMSGAVGLDSQIPRLVATPTDSAGHAGMPKVAPISSVPIRSAGQACDVRGFDVCGTGLSCTPGIPGEMNRCMSASPLRTAQCNAAPILMPTPMGAKVAGVAEGGSLWDAPPGCSSADPKGRPEGVVKLRLTSRAQKLTLSTAGQGTNFDTTVYMMLGCPNDSVDSLGCSDDAAVGTPTSQLVLMDVAPGDYLVVVDSFDTQGGSFELTATVE